MSPCHGEGSGFDSRQTRREPRGVHGCPETLYGSGRQSPTIELIMYYVYILKSLVDLKLYIGYTKNLSRRFEEHQKGENVSTKSRRPFVLIFYEAYKSQVDAKRREKYFKTSKGKSTLKMMLQDSLGRPAK